MPASTEIVNRKLSHFDLCANQDVEFRRKTTLFEDVELVHQPLVVPRLEDCDLSVVALGKRLKYPLIITGMTGGAEEVARFNREVAALADRMGVGFGVGSQRVALRHPEMKKTFQVRDVAPDVLLFGNIGVAQARELSAREVTRLAEEIGADAMCVHMQAAKALALGAKVVGVALPVLRAYVSGGIEGVEAFLKAFGDELRVALMLCGCAKVDDLTPDHAVIGGRLLEWVEQRGLATR